MLTITHSSYLRTLALAAIIVALAAITGTALAEPAPFRQDPFTDIPTSHPNYKAIEYLRVNNIIHGYEDGEFKPDRRINRAEFVTLVTNPFFLQVQKMNDCIGANGLNESDTVFFPDVRRDAWYAEEVCIAKVKDLINGYPDGSFKPGHPITFVEAAKILSNTFALNVREEGEVWYEPYVTKLGELHAIPMSVTSLNGLVTRGEVAEMLYRLKADDETKASRTYANLKGRYE